MAISPILAYKVTRNDFITSNVIHMDCVPLEGERPAFKAGQFMMMHWRDADGKLIDKPHSFSIASAPHEPGLSFAIKIYGPYTTRLSKEILAGTTIHLQGPFGLFTLEKVTDPEVVLLAGGVGIAPFRGILYHELGSRSGLTQMNTRINAEHSPRTFHVLYSNKTKTTFPYMEELDALALAQPDRLKINYTITQDESPEWKGGRGRWTAESISQVLQGYEGKMFFVCGPPPFVTEMVEQLQKMGVVPQKIKIEKFT